MGSCHTFYSTNQGAFVQVCHTRHAYLARGGGFKAPSSQLTQYLRHEYCGLYDGVPVIDVSIILGTFWIGIDAWSEFLVVTALVEYAHFCMGILDLL